MRTITKILFGSPDHSGMSASALVTLAIAALALVVLALSATTAQSAERHNVNTIAPSTIIAKIGDGDNGEDHDDKGEDNNDD